MRITRLRLAAAALAAAVVVSVALLWPPGGGDGLVIYSAMGPPEAMIPAFESETGLHVTYINMGGGPLQARVYAQGLRPRWTLVWFVGDAAMAALDHAALLARHAPDDPTWPAVAWTGYEAIYERECIPAPPPGFTPDDPFTRICGWHNITWSACLLTLTIYFGIVWAGRAVRYVLAGE